MSDPQKYRTKEEVEEYKHRDPIEQVRHTILDTRRLLPKRNLRPLSKK
jgi:pyruvate dehydrogenase E1 component alpha subunit